MVEGSDYRPPRSRAPATAATGAPAWATTTDPARDPLRESTPMHHDIPRNQEPPATPGVYWIVAGVGIGLLCLGNLIRFFAIMDDIPDEHVAAALFAVLGAITLAVGLALAAIAPRGAFLTLPLRAALLLGAAYVAFHGSGWTNFFGVGLF